jgi:hypothetical protein
MARKRDQNEGRSDCQEVYMLKTGDELRAAARDRVRKHRAKQTKIATKPADPGRIVQVIITFRLPMVVIRRIS